MRLSYHAQIRLFERFGVKLTKAEVKAICQTLEEDEAFWPDNAVAFVDVKLSHRPEVFQCIISEDHQTIKTVLTGRPKSSKTRIKKAAKRHADHKRNIERNLDSWRHRAKRLDQ